MREAKEAEANFPRGEGKVLVKAPEWKKAPKNEAQAKEAEGKEAEAKEAEAAQSIAE